MLESLIRPFEIRPVTGTRRLVGKSKKQAAQTAQLTWGTAGTLPTAVVDTAPDDTTNPKTKRQDQQNTETKRSVQKYRVENPDDPTQFVEVERVVDVDFDFVNKEAPGFLFTLNKTTGVTTITNTGGETNKAKNKFYLSKADPPNSKKVGGVTEVLDRI